tara:strand:- start:1296 stop:2156 length:861 start_codon:yes stop_codon:yes gene_type:complete
MTTSFENDLLNRLQNEPDSDFILNNLDVINSMHDAPKKIDAFSQLINPRRDISKKIRKGTKKTSVNPHYCVRKCINCDKILTHAEHTCSSCAVVQEVDWLEMPSVNDMKYNIKTHSSITCAYKRINHFNEKLSQFQGKEKTVIPDEIYDRIRDEIYKNPKLSLESLTPREMKYILKKLGLSKYYEHINYITNKINSYKLPTLSPEEEDKLRHMFNEIQEPFAKYSPNWRKNFLNYAYIFRKFMELLSYDYLLENFSELKSREKLYEQDKIWKKICNQLKWQFIPSL